MNDLSFRPAAAPMSLATLAAEVVARLPAGADPDRLVHAVAAVDRAGPADVAAFGDGDDVEDLRRTQAAVCLLAARHLDQVPAHTIALVTESPLEALGRLARLLHPRHVVPGPVFDRSGIDPAAIVHSDADLEQGVVVDPGVVIGPKAEIGAATTIGANSVIGAGVRIGRGCAIDAQVSIRCALIGDRVTIHAGARIGADDCGSLGGMPLLGRVIIQDGATIGANAVVARGHLGDTTIGDGACVAAQAIVRPDTTLGRCEILEGPAFPSMEEMV